jgi:hypothetical protein
MQDVFFQYLFFFANNRRLVVPLIAGKKLDVDP